MCHQPRLAWRRLPNAPICTTRPEAPADWRAGHSATFWVGAALVTALAVGAIACSITCSFETRSISSVTTMCLARAAEFVGSRRTDGRPILPDDDTTGWTSGARTRGASGAPTGPISLPGSTRRGSGRLIVALGGAIDVGLEVGSS